MPPGVSGDGLGGARKRWKNANFSIALRPAGVVGTSGSVPSLETVGEWRGGVGRGLGGREMVGCSVAGVEAPPKEGQRGWVLRFPPDPGDRPVVAFVVGAAGDPPP